MDLRVLVVGGGRAGRKAAESFLEYGQQPVLIDSSEDVVTELRDRTTE